MPTGTRLRDVRAVISQYSSLPTNHDDLPATFRLRLKLGQPYAGQMGRWHHQTRRSALVLDAGKLVALLSCLANLLGYLTNTEFYVLAKDIPSRFGQQLELDDNKSRRVLIVLLSFSSTLAKPMAVPITNLMQGSSYGEEVKNNNATYRVKVRQPQSVTWSNLLVWTVASGTYCIRDHQSEMRLTIPAPPTPSRDDRHDEWTGLPLGVAHSLLPNSAGWTL
ncbi:uncharacterized protein BDZ83DRAFT_767254 [Colletotrichum acutatum]|uniref:Uncharacterized protein n=1 Tax=Glomerella acutata TaxID=27357 RepID=A0AAD8U706_GLOAC|nr:uncharacterized protein BDZ83DRAFT_767254 [Colletotrichum acutatum]KAK1709691.1 hypothetical protein BDZ83DRAFT_767254 [Colletotrichum acutatum]